MTSPLACSIIIPTISRSTLDRAVTSVLEQRVSSDLYEIIVVNDSGAPLPHADWQACTKVQILNTNRVERCFARNAGAAVARGTFLLFLDDDDYLLPTGLQLLVDKAASSESDLISGGVNIVDEQGALVRTYLPYCLPNMFAQFVMGGVLQLSHTLVRRSAFMRVGGFDPQFLRSQDCDLECRIALTGSTLAIRDVVACVRLSGAAGSTTNFSKSQATLLIRERALNLPNALARLQAALQQDPIIRPRLARNLLGSAQFNFTLTEYTHALRRLGWFIRIAGFNVLRPIFWDKLRTNATK